MNKITNKFAFSSLKTCIFQIFVVILQRKIERKEQTMTIIKSKVKQNQVPRLRAEIPENLSRAGRWLMEHPNGIGVIVNRRAVNK